MLKRLMLLAPLLAVWIAVPAAQAPAPAGRRVLLGDWPEARGPRGDGRSDEKGLIDKWALNGQNFLWRAPYGGRSAPVVMGNRVYVQNPAGLGDQMQERVMALDADSGKLVWEYKFNVFQSDVPPHRVGWASPAIDPETGNIYAMGVGATVIALSKDGKLLWDHSIGEEFAAFTTHGGRTTSPIIDGNLVIVSAAISSWGAGASRQHRFVALDKRNGEIIWIASPGGRPYDTNYAAPLITRIKDLRLLISGSGDGGVYAMKPQTGEKVWGTVIAKRAVNTGVVVVGNDVIVSHGDENLDVPELGMVGAIDGSQNGDIKTVKWAQKGDQFGFSSPVVDGSILYIVENGSRLKAYDTETGKSLWTQTLGTIQKAPLVFADGKLYAGTESGKFFIVKPSASGAQVLSEVEMPLSKDDNAGQTAGIPEPIFGGAAVSRGRIFFVSTGGVYAIGAKTATKPTGVAVNEPADTGAAPAAWVQVYPTEVVIKAGEKQAFHARTFDGRGRFLHEEPAATFALAGLKGTIDASGVFTADAAAGDQAGIVKATVGGLSGEARARVVRPLPWTETFESYADGGVPPGWIIVGTAKTAVATIDAQKALYKAPDNTIFKRYRGFVGDVNLSDYTIEADVRGTTKRRQMSDLGVTAQRYSLILYGNAQQLTLQPWEPETKRTVLVPFKWEADTWYHLKLRVENMPDGKVRARGKAWATGQPEPEAWTIEKIDPIGNHKGAPGFFIDAEFGAYIDNIKVAKNQ
jgi:outer membrane protein assembly factor BamB